MDSRAYSGDYLAHDPDQGGHTMTYDRAAWLRGENGTTYEGISGSKERGGHTMTHTPGPMTVTPFLTPDEDDDPMMVYEVKGGDLQERFDNLQTDEDGEYNQDEVDAIHAENAANAKLIEDAFNVAHETGKTPRQLQEENRVLRDRLDELLGVLDVYADMWSNNQAEYGDILDSIDNSKKALAKAEGRVS